MEKLGIIISDRLFRLLRDMRDVSQLANIICSGDLKTGTDEKFPNFIDVCDRIPGNFTFLSKDRSLRTEHDEIWTTSLRQSIRPGKLIHTILPQIDDKEVEQFTILFRTKTSIPEHTFKIVTGDRIAHYYLMDNYSEISGELDKSCLRYPHVNHHLRMIQDNPDKIGLLVMVDNDDKVLGRALLWDTNEGHKVMDKIYTTSNPTILEMFKDWARNNGYLTKTYQSSKKPLQFNTKNGDEIIKLSVNITKTDYDYYPFFDTFKWVDMEENTLYNHIPGYFLDTDRFKALTRDSGVAIDAHSLNFDETDLTVCNIHEMRLVDGKLVGKHNFVFSDTYNEYLFKEHTVWSEHLEDHIYKESSRNDKQLMEERFELLTLKKKREKFGPYDYSTSPTFTHKGVNYRYSVSPTHLVMESGGLTNRTLLEQLNADIVKVCKTSYGYVEGTRGLPSYKTGDMEAANRLIATIRQMIVYSEGWEDGQPLPLFFKGEVHNCVKKNDSIVVVDDTYPMNVFIGKKVMDIPEDKYSIEIIKLNREKEGLVPIEDLFLKKKPVTQSSDQSIPSSEQSPLDDKEYLYTITRQVQKLGYENITDFFHKLNMDNIDILDYNSYYGEINK